MIGANFIKLKLFFKENWLAALGVFLAVVLAAGLAVYWFAVKRPAEVEKGKIVSEEEAKGKILKSLTAPSKESKLTPEEENKLLKSLSAPKSDGGQTTQKLKEENKELFDALSAPH